MRSYRALFFFRHVRADMPCMHIFRVRGPPYDVSPGLAGLH